MSKRVGSLLLLLFLSVNLHAVTFLGSVSTQNINGTVGISQGGTSATTATAAREALFVAKSGVNSDITSITSLNSNDYALSVTGNGSVIQAFSSGSQYLKIRASSFGSEFRLGDGMNEGEYGFYVGSRQANRFSGILSGDDTVLQLNSLGATTHSYLEFRESGTKKAAIAWNNDKNLLQIGFGETPLSPVYKFKTDGTLEIASGQLLCVTANVSKIIATNTDFGSIYLGAPTESGSSTISFAGYNNNDSAQIIASHELSVGELTFLVSSAIVSPNGAIPVLLLGPGNATFNTSIVVPSLTSSELIVSSNSNSRVTANSFEINTLFSYVRANGDLSMYGFDGASLGTFGQMTLSSEATLLFSNQYLFKSSTGNALIEIEQVGGIHAHVPATFDTVTITTLNATGIVGIVDGSNAATTNVGKYMSSQVPAASKVSLTSNTYKDVTSITLSAGDWDLNGNVTLNNDAGACEFPLAGFGTVTGDDATGLVAGDTMALAPLGPIEGADLTIIIPASRVSVSSPTTIYLKTRVTVNSGTIAAYGKITARRVR